MRLRRRAGRPVMPFMDEIAEAVVLLAELRRSPRRVEEEADDGVREKRLEEIAARLRGELENAPS